MKPISNILLGISFKRDSRALCGQVDRGIQEARVDV